MCSHYHHFTIPPNVPKFTQVPLNPQIPSSLNPMCASGPKSAWWAINVCGPLSTIQLRHIQHSSSFSALMVCSLSKYTFLGVWVWVSNLLLQWSKHYFRLKALISFRAEHGFKPCSARKGIQGPEKYVLQIIPHNPAYLAHISKFCQKAHYSA